MSASSQHAFAWRTSSQINFQATLDMTAPSGIFVKRALNTLQEPEKIFA